MFSAHDFYQLERKIEILQIENEIFNKSKCSIISPLADKFKAIDNLKNEYSVHSICKALNVLKSSYYHYLLRSPDKKKCAIIDAELRPLISNIFHDSKERFGSPKIKFALKELGYTVSRKHISRLMKEMQLICKQQQLRYYSTTNRKYKVYKNRVQQKFSTEAPNMIWVSDITYVHVKQALYGIAVIIDLYARVVVNFDVAKEINSAFIQKIFDKAYITRNKPQGLIFHSDQGAQYTAFEFRSHLRTLNVKSSFSNPGTPLDNAVAESFFACMKREELSHNYYDTFEDLYNTVQDYIDFFNNKRPHQKLGMLTPCKAEQQYLG